MNRMLEKTICPVIDQITGHKPIVLWVIYISRYKCIKYEIIHLFYFIAVVCYDKDTND